MNEHSEQPDSQDSSHEKREAEQREEQLPQPNEGMPWWQRWLSWPVLLLLLMIAVFFWQPGKRHIQIEYSRFRSELEKGNVTELVARGETLTGKFDAAIPVGQGEESRDVTRFKTTLPPWGDRGLTDLIVSKNVTLVSEGKGDNTFWIVLINLLPLLLLVGIGYLLFRRASRAGGGGGGIMSIGKSKAKQFTKERTSATFDDVAGVEQAKRELQEIISFLREPERYTRLGCRVPKGILLVGAPGTGKTLLARAVAGEAEVPFFSITGSDFMEMFVGVGASRVRDLFAKAKATAPCIIFVDELDSIGRHRGAGLGGGHDEREQTLNQLLSEIDGFEPYDNVVVIGATNRPDILDPALLRTGRFDRRVVVDLPTFPERLAILKVHTRRVPLADNVDLEDIARAMPGRSGADLNNLVNEAALLAARKEKDTVGNEEFSEARDKVLMGQLRGGVKLGTSEKHVIAVHEGGHARVAHLSAEADPVDKVTIIPRGRALGATQQLPEERFNLTEAYLRARLKVMFGGRASEEILIGTISTGAADDLKQATRLARRMVSEWGMSDEFRHLAFGDGDSEVFLGEQIAQRKDYSDDTEREIDLSVKALIDSCYQEAHKLLKENRKRLEDLVDQLEEKEVLEGDALANILGSEDDAEATAGSGA